MPTARYQRNDFIKRSSFGNHHTENWYRQNWSVDAKIYGWDFDDDQDSYKVSKCLPLRHLLIIRGKLWFDGEKPNHSDHNQVMEQMCPDSVHGQGHSKISLVFQPSHKPKLSLFYNKTGLSSSKITRSWKACKEWRASPSRRKNDMAVKWNTRSNLYLERGRKNVFFLLL